ncbi:hypothetical protein [Bradyrhizobium liaoningense]|uniref:hypothetical protein n=1 Tax=Bradyrhizobium liaoningense TaxID=43992 RepID=UPI0012FDB991|nr:hypothetical protein [Bradyrhizobium liaoningense]
MADAELKRVALSPDRWQMLVKHFAAFHPALSGGPAEPIERFTIGAPIEIEGVTVLPAVYYPD